MTTILKTCFAASNLAKIVVLMDAWDIIVNLFTGNFVEVVAMVKAGLHDVVQNLKDLRIALVDQV